MTFPNWALIGDLRFAFRYFTRHKATVAIIVVVLAIGTGVNTTIFSFFQSHFLRPAPAIPKDASHARIWGQQRDSRLAAWKNRNFTWPELVALANRPDVFRDVAGWKYDEISFAVDSSAPRVLRAQFVTPNYFATLGVRVIAGQGLSRDASETPNLTAVIAESYATELFGTPANAIGKTVFANEVPIRIVGVAPVGFQGANLNAGSFVLWLPFSARASVSRVAQRWYVDEPSFSVVARLAPGANREQASALASQLAVATLPDSADRVGMSRSATVLEIYSRNPTGSSDTLMEFVGMGAVGVLILLVGWMNVSSLMVAAAVGRKHEIAVRLSMGASRARIMRQLLTESTLLAVTGGLLGLTLAWWILTYAERSGGDVNLAPDAVTFGFTMLLSVATGVLFGLSPALNATRGQLANSLRDAKAGGTARAGLQRVFVAAQIMLSQPLLVMLGVLVMTLIAVYEPHAPSMSGNVIRVEFRPLWETGAPGQRREGVDSLIPRIAKRAEVVGVVHEAGPFSYRSVKLEGAADSGLTNVQLVGSAPGWFGIVDVPLLLGRDVSYDDTAATQPPVVIGNTLARRLFGDANPIGRRFLSPPRNGTRQDSIAYTVVGVYDATHRLTDGAFEGEHGDSTPHVFTAAGKMWRPEHVLVRTRAAAAPFIPELQRYVREQAPSLPVVSMQTLRQIDDEAYSMSLTISGAIVGGAAAALLLASLGLYGVVSLAVQQRTREIGIRIAVGGQPRAVARMFLVSGVKVSAIGLLLGLPVSMAALKVAMSQGVLEEARGVSVGLIGATITLLLLGVASVATWLPARRAATVDPASTLRVE